MLTRGLILLLVCLLSGPALAVKAPTAGKADPRIKTFTYHERDVYRINAHYEFGTTIILGDDENILLAIAGNSYAWMIEHKANYILLKPIENNPDTNLWVLTEDSTGKQRNYNFELRGSDAKNINDEALTFSVLFRYPEREMAAALKKQQQLVVQQKKVEAEADRAAVVPDHRVDASQWNFAYVRKGDDAIAPIHVFDDGTFTYFQFNPKLATPAIFLVDESGRETLVNHHLQGKYLVVQRVGRQFTLRHGELTSCIYNSDFDAQIAGNGLTGEGGA